MERFPQAESGSLRWLVDGEQFFPELNRQIEAVRSSIHIQLTLRSRIPKRSQS
jgi:phosphatidylserine/phosphatidylglycerophosphate/cardiolipin synthase-like enzyme